MKKPPAPLSTHEHDHLFSDALSDPRIARDFLQQHLPTGLIAQLNLDTLTLCKDKLIDANLDSRVTDMLFRVQLKDPSQDAYIATLLEHRSTPDKYMPLRVLHYECGIMRQHLKTYGKLPLVYSLVYYHGQKKWAYPTDLKALIDAPSELIEQYALKPFQLVDLSTLSDDSLRKHLWSGLLGMVMKHIFDRDVLPVLKELVTWMKDLERQDGREFIHSLWYYIYKKGSIRDEAELKTLIIDQLPDTAGEEVMATLAQIHLERGRQEGKQEGIMEGWQKGQLDGERLLLQRLIERRFGALPPHYAEKIAAAQEDELMLWSERMFQAKQVQAIFEENSSLKN